MNTNRLTIRLENALLNKSNLRHVGGFVLFTLLVPLLTLLRGIRVRILLILVQLPIFSLLGRTVLVPLGNTKDKYVRREGSIKIIITSHVRLMSPDVIKIIRMHLTLIANNRTPTTIPTTIQLLPMTMTGLMTLRHSTINNSATVNTLPIERRVFCVFHLCVMIPVATKNFMRLFPRRLRLVDRVYSLVLARRLTSIMFRQILNGVHRKLIRYIVLL